MRRMRSIEQNRTIERVTGYKPGTIGARQGIQSLSGYKPGTIGGERYIAERTADRKDRRDLGTY